MLLHLAVAAAVAVTGVGGAPAGPAPTSVPALPAAPLDDGGAEVTLLDIVVPAPGAGARLNAPDTVVAATPVAERVESQVVEPGTFQTLGVTWPHGTDVQALDARVRTRAASGDWTEWVPLTVADDGPDTGTADAGAARGGTDPLWVGEADAVQVSFPASLQGGPAGLALTLVDVPEEPVTAALVPQAALAGAPRVISRAEWGARPQACQPDVASKGLVGAVVHHTAGSNAYSTMDEAKRQIRGDQAYHIDGRGWCDIGYNFIVDKWGNIYEGRADSMTEAVIGVHAGGFNTGTVGVSMLGNYETATAPSAMLSATAQIIGWRLGMTGIDPAGTMTYYTYGGENSRYTGGTSVTLPRIFGHRDVSYTSCPGRYGYAQLPAIRTMAKDTGYHSRFLAGRATVEAIYQDLLQRPADDAGLDYWSDQLATGVPVEQVVNRVTSGREYAGLRVKQFYITILGREADEQGLKVWVDRATSGAVVLDDIPMLFMSRPEFATAAGGTDEGFVSALYEVALGRTAAENEVQLWVDRMVTLGRAGAVTRIYGSPEAARLRVTGYYQQLLGREPDAGGLDKWERHLRTVGEASVRVKLLSSAEYRDRAVSRFL